MIETILLTKQRIAKYLAEGKRFDGRSPDTYREISIEIGVSKKAEGSARVRIGKTEVVVGVKMDVAEPYADSQDEGILMVTAELLPLSSSRFESGPPKFEAIEIGRLVDRGLRESKVIDFGKLCIKEGEKVWMLFVDLYSINDDGNLLDAFALGALAALKSARLPKYNEKTGKVQYGEWTQEKIPFTNAVPLTVTVHKIGDHFLVDPTKEEEDSVETNVMLAISEGPMINALQKNGGKHLSIPEMEKVIDIAESVWKKNYAKVLKDLEALK